MKSLIRFLKTRFTNILLKSIEIFKKISIFIEKVMKNVLEKIKSKIKDKKIIPGILVALIILTISWVILPYMVLLLFDLKRSSIIYNPDNFIKYRMISMTLFFLIRGFIRRKVEELVDNHGLYGILWLLFIIIVVWLLYYFIGWW